MTSELEIVELVPQFPVAVAVPVAAGSVDWSHSTVMSGGQTRTGGVEFTTFMI